MSHWAHSRGDPDMACTTGTCLDPNLVVKASSWMRKLKIIIQFVQAGIIISQPCMCVCVAVLFHTRVYDGSQSRLCHNMISIK